MLRQPKKVSIEIARQGGPVVNSAWLEARGPKVAAVGIDLASKNCAVEASFSGERLGPGIFISAGNGLYLQKGLENEISEVRLPEFAGWVVWSAEISRYTCYVCLVKLKIK